ncbi:MAG: ABC transporter permease [Patescibacteria group bacterium]|nr:ABC transporter permease [Patescibacteria group bacterium]
MMFNDLMHETYAALTVNLVRSGLTVLGIVIGIGSVIAMLAIGQGARGSIESSIQSIGSNLLIVMPGFQRGVGQQVSSGRGSAQTLTMEDAEAISQQVTGVLAVAPDLSRRYQLTASGTNTNVSVIGTVPAYLDVRNLQVDTGSFITESQNDSAAKVVVLGPTTRDDLFGEGEDTVGKSVRVNRIEFKVIGVTVSKGGSGMTNQDDQVYVPIATAQRYLAGQKYVSTISVQAETAEVMTDVQEQITNLLLDRHNISDATQADFNVMNQTDIVAAASSVTETFTMLLAAIASISLIVGGIGIMNMMLTTVTERTREIGLRKAIGARRRDISAQFLVETLMLTFLGGFIGILAGWAGAVIIGKLASTATSVTSQSVLLAFGVSAVIGIVFGYYPARRASRLDPITALRYE